MIRWKDSDDSGAVAVIVALCMVLLVAFVALAVDVGYFFDTRKQLQASADAAALAGCQALIEGGSASVADATAREYALRNANGPAAGLAVDSVEIDGGAEPWSVKVVVSRTAPSFFAGVFRPGGLLIHADAKAAKGRLAGARYLVPWAIPILREDDIDHVEAELVSGNSVVSGPVSLSHSGTRRYSGAITAPSAPGGYDLIVRIYNVYGIEEPIGDSKGPQPAARVVVPAPNSPIASITMSGDYLANDAPEYPTITLTTTGTPTGGPPKLNINGKKRTMSGSGTHWTYTVGSGDISFDDEYLNSFPVDIYFGNKADGVDTYVHVRRSTYPVSDCWVDPIVSSPGGSVGVTMELNEFNPVDFVPGQIYTLRVASDGVESGNFGELNFKKITHTGACPPDPVGLDYGNTYYGWLSEGYPGGIHVNDIITLSPGKSGNNTPKALDERQARYGEVIVSVPIVTKYEQKSGGSYDVIVRELAAFRLTDWGSAGGAKGEVEGEFLEYIGSSSSYFPPGSGTGTVYAAYLVNP